MQQVDFICPYCGDEYQDVDGIFVTSESADVDCSGCEKVFRVVCHVTKIYRSYKKENGADKGGDSL